MTKNIVSLILSLIFVAFLVAPTIIVMVDDSVDISFFYDSSDEEEKGNEKNKDIEILVFKDFHCEADFDSLEEENILEYFFKNYPKPHLNLISPPPEHILYI
ncbi:hypothetical protein A8C32_12590 [Flavivirga aquatica]|uniref:Uncharacterized protein n=1 Tax=Flavivirga aquatica TaxID=1849968 RepID=A0A1E5TDX1_9FLAO|nr:hypothetical protein [Flavivirga aquatica]OEK09538.1 hypothetical protein A8C32_12590 [Flavivirga aquatica]